MERQIITGAAGQHGGVAVWSGCVPDAPQARRG